MKDTMCWILVNVIAVRKEKPKKCWSLFSLIFQVFERAFLQKTPVATGVTH